MSEETKKKLALLSMVLASCVRGGEVWHNIDHEDHLGGAQITAEEKLVGRVVLVDVWGKDCPPCREMLPHLEAMWKSFGLPADKPFVVLGSHRQARDDSAIERLIKENNLTYPIYQNAGLVNREPNSGGRLPFMYVLNHRGKVVYRGRNWREAQEAVINALGEVGKLPSLTAGVSAVRHPGIEKKLEIGKPIASVVKRLESEAKGADVGLAAEAQRILGAIEQAKRELVEEIEFVKGANAREALRLIKLMKATWPKEAEERYRGEFGSLVSRARTKAREEKQHQRSKK